VQYLAEIQKTQAAFGLGGKVQVRLLARNAGENNWQPIGNDQLIQIQDPSQVQDLKDGQLVIADITGSNVVQSVTEASKRIVGILQNFSRAQERFRAAEEEVEQWKQSLNYQSQELHRREQELENREIELETLEARRQEAEEILARLESERGSYESMQAAAAGLSAEQSRQLMGIVNDLSESLNTNGTGSIDAGELLQLIYDRQNILNGFWQQLDSMRQEVDQRRRELGQSQEVYQQRLQQWQSAQIALSDAQAELKAQRNILKLQENNLALGKNQLSVQDHLHEKTVAAIEALGGTPNEVLSPEEVKRLEELPIEELEAAVSSLQTEFDKLANYVSAQEDELASIEGEIADIQSQMDKINEFERIELENSKEFAEEQYKLLEESVSGMRRGMQERQAALSQRRAILDRRKGNISGDDPFQHLIPLLQQIDAQRSHQKQELEKMEQQIDAVRNYIQQQQDSLNRQLQEHQTQQQELKNSEAALLQLQSFTAELGGKVLTQEHLLRPVQDIIDALRPKLEFLANGAPTSSSSTHLVQELRTVLSSMV
jgi:chromosome segregation ATPase